MISKINLRKKLLQKRKTLNTMVLSNLICEKIKLEKVYIEAKIIFAYYPKLFEVDITPLFKDKSKKWFLPKTTENNLIFYEYKYGDELIKEKFGVFEPKPVNKAKNIPDLIIIPALGVDKNNYRIGYGKGYYDRYLTEFKNPPATLTPIFSDLIVSNLPVETHDKKIDFIISEM